MDGNNICGFKKGFFYGKFCLGKIRRCRNLVGIVSSVLDSFRIVIFLNSDEEGVVGFVDELFDGGSFFVFFIVMLILKKGNVFMKKGKINLGKLLKII